MTQQMSEGQSPRAPTQVFTVQAKRGDALGGLATNVQTVRRQERSGSVPSKEKLQSQLRQECVWLFGMLTVTYRAAARTKALQGRSCPQTAGEERKGVGGHLTGSGKGEIRTQHSWICRPLSQPLTTKHWLFLKNPAFF